MCTTLCPLSSSRVYEGLRQYTDWAIPFYEKKKHCFLSLMPPFFRSFRCCYHYYFIISFDVDSFWVSFCVARWKHYLRRQTVNLWVKFWGCIVNFSLISVEKWYLGMIFKLTKATSLASFLKIILVQAACKPILQCRFTQILSWNSFVVGAWFSSVLLSNISHVYSLILSAFNRWKDQANDKPQKTHWSI